MFLRRHDYWLSHIFSIDSILNLEDNHSDPGWLEITIRINPVAHEGLFSYLYDLGCEGIVTESFHDQDIKAYLPPGNDLEEFRTKIELYIQNLKEIFPDINKHRLSFRWVKDQDWSLLWKKFFTPDKVTDQLMVVPEWEPDPPEWKGYTIRIDPGPAFGTGRHPTTRLCLAAMEKIRLPNKWTMIDVGTGSGILAVYGLILGASKIFAIDIDHEAIRWSKYNIGLNSPSGKIQVSTTPIGSIVEIFSLVMGNLLLSTILELSDDLYRILAPEGYMVLSGLLGEQVETVKKEFYNYGLFTDQVLYEDEWACLILKN